jgi:hypothetical protein
MASFHERLLIDTLIPAESNNCRSCDPLFTIRRTLKRPPATHRRDLGLTLNGNHFFSVSGNLVLCHT